MNTASVSTYAGSGVRLNPLYSLLGAGLGTALVCVLLVWAFAHPLPNTPAQLMQLSLVAVSASQPKPVAPSPSRHFLTPRSVTAKPVVIPESNPIKPVTPAPLDLSLPGLTFAPPTASAFVPPVFNPYSDLYRALTAPAPPPGMQNGDAYRSEYGFDLVKSSGQCLAPQTVQVGLSPSAHTTVGFLVPCPGEYKPSMADEFKAWAERHSPERYPRPR
ncbi:MAG: hypothetical protein ACRER9_02565 [Gammaproteobacteria bacterium]